MADSLPGPVERAWIVGSIWSGLHLAHRRESPELSALMGLIGSDVADQVRGLQDAAAAPYQHVANTAKVLAAIAALQGEGLQQFLSESHFAGVRWSDLDRTTDEATRADVMHLLALALAEGHPALSQAVHSASHADVIEQLATVWVVWTHANIAPEYFAAAALARLALFGVGRDDLFCVSMKIQGLM